MDLVFAVEEPEPKKGVAFSIYEEMRRQFWDRVNPNCAAGKLNTVQLEHAEEECLPIIAWRVSTTRAFAKSSQCLKTLAWILTLGVGAVFFLGSCLYADQAQYLYDDQGRLTSVSDSAGTTAVYNYDAVGNLLSIDRFTPPGSGIGIYLVNPIIGPATQLCRLQGYGFDRWADRKEAGSLR